jgi:hypothetical protein
VVGDAAFSRTIIIHEIAQSQRALLFHSCGYSCNCAHPKTKVRRDLKASNIGRSCRSREDNPAVRSESIEG